MPTSKCSPRNQSQRGVSLLIVLMVLLLTMTAIAGALRVANLNEALVGSGSDYQRTLAAAEALLQDAETDIRGRLPPYDKTQADGQVGTPCLPDSTGLADRANVIGCRNVTNPPSSGNQPWFPRNPDEYDSVAAIVAAHSNQLCSAGICVPGSGTFYSNTSPNTGTPIENNLNAMLPLGAFYGQFTGVQPGTVSSNPVLTSNTTPPFARYWVEVLRYGKAVGASSNLAFDYEPDDLAPFVYRITVVAQGLKPGSKVVLRSLFVPNPKAQNG